ncbi:Fasciclin-domain-containing protein [Aspergillus eucalypticola CBS 122712]|uniref:Fasciclin-domain-containing protein n=1 Tax=Aspergillus eucalypticola (strain CBS 122712 / IBT 29274) TaxID=1448314 RepID=A0A317WBM7_ASPEC|nr:Fasciclin-domain-containing protein [Aspergillus eucalypticola CBS 122712]PWY82747.1 Fasciclin-domain-containing protein [Aspergillus eucalypticola CBS 122712]
MASTLVTVAALAAIVIHLVTASPLMDTLLQVPDLSTYAEVYNLTGGIVEINPLFLKRYNYDEDKRNYTFLAPTNDAWAKIPDAIFDILMTQQAYPLTEALLRTHIIEAGLTASELVKVSESEGAGGISTSLQVSNTTEQYHNGVLTKTVQGYYIDSITSSNDTVQIDDQSAIVTANIVADNGLIHAIDQVIDPFLIYGGGPSNRTMAPTSETTDLTIGELLKSDSRLVNSSKILFENSPDTLRRLSQQTGSTQFFVAPRNEAYDLMPTILPIFHTLVAPYKSPFNTLMWQYGWLDSDGDTFAGLNFSSPITVASDITGLNITVTQEENAIFIMNAGLVTQVRTSNGYLWIVDRWLDPLYQAFGPIDRFGTPEWP